MVTRVLQTLYITKTGPIYTSEAAKRNTVVSYHCPSFRDWRPSIILGAFFSARFVINGRHE